MIPLCDVRRQYEALRCEIDDAMRSVAASGQYILGPQVEAFESEIARFCGAQWAVGVGNGTDALHLVLRALDIGPGDEVITTPFTFVATSEAICLVGARPVLADINPHTLNIDPACVDAAITQRTKALIPVHLYGQACDMTSIMELAGRHGLYVVEDCAQALGATFEGRSVGTSGDAGCFSFFPSKNLGAMGDGGLVLTNHQHLYERIEMLRRHGGRVKYRHELVGLNSRLDELQAAVLRVKLRHLSQWNQRRRQLACRYNQLLEQAELQCPKEEDRGRFYCAAADRINTQRNAVYHQYTVLLDQRDAVQDVLQKMAIGSAVYYPVPLHLQAVHADLGYPVGSFPVAEDVARRCLSLPMFPELLPGEQETVASSLLEAIHRTERHEVLR